MRAAIRLVLCGALVCLTATAARAQTTTTSETKKFQIISVDGNTLVVKLPEGTREMAVADDFRFNVDGKMLSVQELKPGMSGTATITTKTTVTPVVVTEVKNGTVMQNLGTSILVRTESGMKMFSQADIDKRGIKIYREGKLAEISGLPCQRQADRHHRHDQATTGHDGEGSQRDPGQERWRWCCRRARGRCRRARGRCWRARGRTQTRRIDATDGSRIHRLGDVRCCAEEAAQDGQPAAGSCTHRLRLAPGGVGPCRQASSRDALTVRQSTPGCGRDG